MKILTAAMRADDTATPSQQSQILKIARGAVATPGQTVNGHEPRIYSRAEAAKLLGDKSPRYIDLLSKRGLIKKFIPKGNVRAIGVCGESLRAFVEGN